MTLPPLPASTVPFQYNDLTVYTAAQMRAYAAAAVAAEREACAKLCDQTPPYPFRPSIEAAHAIRARATD